MSEGKPVRELSDEELEQQGTHAHATRNWVFLHGTADQFQHHTERMLELEQEYLRRHPKRTWQGSGSAPREVDEATRLRLALRGLSRQIGALLADDPGGAPEAAAAAAPNQVSALLDRVRSAGGRMHRLELHQAAREIGISPVALAILYKGPDAVLRTERVERVLTDKGAVGGHAFVPEAERTSPQLEWTQETAPTWDADKQRVFATVPPGVFDFGGEAGTGLAGEWWCVRDESGKAVGYGWMDSGWGDVEVLLAVDSEAQARGVGSFILEHLEQEASKRGENYVYNVVRTSHPNRERLHDWLAVRGYRGSDKDEALRKRVETDTPSAGRGPSAAPAAPAAPAASHESPTPDSLTSSASGESGPEEAGGYVEVEDHRY
jgi:GNAT superfamily N-acetyltransferase